MTSEYNAVESTPPAIVAPADRRVYEKEVIVGYDGGLHVRPVGEIFTYAEDHRNSGGGRIDFVYNGQSLSTESLAPILGANIPKGAKVSIRAYGEGRIIAAHGLAELVSNGAGIWKD